MFVDDELTLYAEHGAPALPANTRESVVENDGARIWYGVHGTGKPVILLHGGLGNSDNWGHQVSALSEGGYRVVLIDSRGHGRSTRDERPLSYALLASDVLAVMDAEGIAAAPIVGWSDGAIVALRLAVAAPRRVSGVFFFGAAADTDGFRQMVPSAKLGRIFTRHIADYERLSASSGGFRPFSEAVNAMMHAQPATTAEQLAALTIPFAVVHAEHDEFVIREHSEYVAAAVPGARLTVLPEVSHFVPLQRPAAFNAVMLAFLATIA